MPNPSLRGRFVWHELMTSDPQSAAAFFGKVVGWKTKAWEQDSSYTMFLTKNRPMAGLMMIPDEAKKMSTPPTWVTYIGTPDLEKTAEQAVALGGRVLKQPTDIPTIGRFAIIQDPQGAVFALFTPLPSSQGSQGPSTDPPGVGDFSWHELATTDWRGALTFYRNLFGWEETQSMDMGPEMGTYEMYGWDGKTVGGMFNKRKDMPGPPAWLPYIKVTDSKGAAATVKKLGGRIINGPMEVPGGDWIAQGLDLQGAIFAVHSAKPAAPKPPAKKAKAKAAKPAARKPVKPKASRKAKKAKKAKPGGVKRARRAAPRRSSRKRSAPRRRR